MRITIANWKRKVVNVPSSRPIHLSPPEQQGRYVMHPKRGSDGRLIAKNRIGRAGGRADGRTDGRTDIQTDRHKDRQTDRQAGRQADAHY